MKINKILSVAVIALAALATTSCNNKKFEIEGSIAQAKDSLLYLENIGLDGIETVDSVKLGENGEFSFSEKATDAPEFYRLRIHDQIVNISIDSTETVKVKADYPTMSYKYDVEGSENCKKIKELALLQMNLQAQINEIVKNPNLSVANVQAAIDDALGKYKYYVKMNYIFKEPNKSYAYFALFQTVVIGNRYALIFNPHASTDDVKVYAAVATSWDTFHPGAIRGENLHNIAIEGMKDARIVENQNSMTIDASKISVTNMIDLSLYDNKGNIRKLSSLNGHVVLLDFCSFAEEGATQRIMQLRELYNKYHAQGLEIYQVSEGDQEHFWKTQSAALPWVSVYDPNGQAAASYNVQSIPTFYLLKKDGSAYKRDVMIKDLDAEIKSLL